MNFSNFFIAVAKAQSSTQASSSTTVGFLQSVVDFLSSQVPRWAGGVVLIFAAVILSRLIKSVVENKLAERGIEEEHREISILAGRTAGSAVLILGVTMGLKVAGIDLTTILAAVAFGIGFALRDLIMNFLAGAMILLARQFTIGDVIKVNETIGRVMEIQSRATILKAFDGTRIIVPNADLFTNQVTSFTSNSFRRIQVEVGVEYDTNLQIALQTVERAIHNTPDILLDPAPSILLSAFGESSINITVRFWVDSRSKWLMTRSNAIKNIKHALDQVGIVIPFPIRTIYQAQDRDAEVYQKTQEGAFQNMVIKHPAPTNQAAVPPRPEVTMPTNKEVEPNDPTSSNINLNNPSEPAPISIMPIQES